MEERLQKIFDKYNVEFNKILVKDDSPKHRIVKSIELRYGKINLIDFSKGLGESLKVSLIGEREEYSEEIASGYISPFKGNCGIAILNGAEVHPYFRGMGIGSLMHKLRIDIAKEFGYSILICTDIERNVIQEKILNKNGWKTVYKFTNKRTGNRINVNILEINE